MCHSSMKAGNLDYGVYPIKSSNLFKPLRDPHSLFLHTQHKYGFKEIISNIDTYETFFNQPFLNRKYFIYDII